MKKKFLKNILSSHFVKFSLVPILVVEVTLIILYFSINKYISLKNTNLMLTEAKNYSQNLLKNEADLISDRLAEISRYATFLQNEHETIFKELKNNSLPNGIPTFDVATNGVFYKTNEIGSSLYYSSHTKITQKEKEKAIYTEAMDTSLKSIVDINPLVMAAYFNSWDDLNRLYPFIPKVYEQYGEHIHMEDYNFYYLADKKHNPTRKPVWTGAYLDPAGNGWMLSSIVPIYKNDFLEGVTGLDITIDTFVKNILNTKLPYDAKLFMVDKDGMIIAMPEKIEELLGLKELKEHLYTDPLLKTIEKPEEYNILRNQAPFASHFKNLMNEKNSSNELKINNDSYITLMESVDETNWKMMILIDKKKIFSSIEELQDLSNKIGYTAIALLILFYIIFFYILLKKINVFSNRITQPIVDLSEQTTLMLKKGQKFKSIDTNVSEIAKLSDNFAYMIRELKLQARKLNNARIVAEEANKSKDEFLANISHELKTPLNSINIISFVMQKNKEKHLDSTEVKNLEIINKCGTDLMNLINDILDYSKLNAGKIVLNYEKIDIKKMILSISEKFNSQIENKKIEFNISMDEALTYMYSDEQRIDQILKNLLSNALKFTPEGKKIDLEVKDLDKNIKIVVKDEGIGISQSKLDKIFDRFIQADATISRKHGGTGLGLTICKEFISLLNGEINVDSQENIGSTFEVILPKNSEEILSDNLKITDVSDLESIFIKPNKKSEEKENIIILNNNFSEFMNVIIELKKKYNLKQILKLEDLYIQINQNNYDKVLIDFVKLSDEEIEYIKNNPIQNLIFIVEDNLSEELKELAIKVISKKDFLNSKVLE